MSIIKQLKWRYATKKFDASKKLSSNQINILKEAFNLTATSFGLQTIKLLIIENKDIRSSLVKYSFNQKQVVDASHLLAICIQKDILKEDVVTYYNNIKDIRNTSETILKPYRESLITTIEEMSVSERQRWSTNQAYIALGNLMAVCAVEGIDSCPMEGFLPDKFDEILGLNTLGLSSVLLLPVGFRAKDDMFSDFKKVRKSLKDTIIEI
ncbi:NAD(P)H-dependent oxidoreductase [Sabulilitoribacter multivorans]|uniref:NAD(P)H-dependent oxidoreductase n=1 Tax=Flaviramulus multivorans TaxID=1304750 RepID=A0ABS9IJT5_9FLAO|nr:NAD(P)H-dependent oxidoreductase [Flaviramulus multivorans]MCF7560853.1 NAD(P)H-dependent oxidoreductase [Flaviramulus multivorans]